MKLSTSTSLLAIAASSVSAQNYNTSGPFQLKLANSANATLNGQVLFACHAGAAIEGLCLGESLTTNASASTTFYHNSTEYSSEGPLVWNLPVRISDSVDHVSEPMSFSYRPDSNVAVPLFMPDYTTTSVDFTSDGKMIVKGGYDDSTFVPGQYPTAPNAVDLSHWYACWTQVGTYFYHALAWVTVGAPHNPTCEAVDVYRVNL